MCFTVMGAAFPSTPNVYQISPLFSEENVSKSPNFINIGQFLSFQIKPQVFVTVQHEHSDRPYDSMNIWLEDVQNNGFVICLREFMTFDGIHSDLKVVSKYLRSFFNLMNDHL